MADVETIPQTPDIEDTVAEVEGTSPEPHGEHVDPGTVDPDSVPQDDTLVDNAVHDVINPIITQENTQPGDTPVDPVPSTKPEVTKKLDPKAAVTASKDKLVISAKARGLPIKSGPPTPTVKKVRLPHLSLMQIHLNHGCIGIELWRVWVWSYKTTPWEQDSGCYACSSENHHLYSLIFEKIY
jgi:hypothetical protein